MGWRVQIIDIENAVDSYCKDPNKLIMRNSALTDGFGCLRIAASIVNTNHSFYLKKCQKNNDGLLFRWANESGNRKNSFNSKIITWSEHQKWLHVALKDNNTLIYIAYDSYGCPIGQVRFNSRKRNKSIRDKHAYIDISLDKSFRGQGLSSPILKRAIGEMQSEWSCINLVVAEVLVTNKVSNLLFAKNGFVPEDLDCYNDKNQEDFLRWVLTV